MGALRAAVEAFGQEREAPEIVVEAPTMESPRPFIVDQQRPEERPKYNS